MTMKCDKCGEVMGDDETGVFLVKKQVGGHIACFREPITREEAMEIAAHHQRLSGRFKLPKGEKYDHQIS